MSYNMGYMLGGLCGVLAGLVFAFFFLKWTKKDHSRKCRFDERQEIVRGRGYKYGFFTLLVGIFLYGAWDSFVEIKFIETFEAVFLIMIVGVMVYIGYCIWNEGYFALNENQHRVMVGFSVIAFLNLAVFSVNLFENNVIEDGVLQPSIMNLACGIMFVYIYLMIAIKRVRDRREEE